MCTCVFVCVCVCACVGVYVYMCRYVCVCVLKNCRILLNVFQSNATRRNELSNKIIMLSFLNICCMNGM